ncbi:hypothetical protein FC28_GL000647 [Lactobacillus crispatus DSM 20584 = JCM 1185 = ATCC 33820]|jgi:hypothetical protein|nr:hypothetical protein FC28_GL000647 [Lactobacillus crispatus DSM 20584 = JCM 1185 = ATCC 33820]
MIIVPLLYLPDYFLIYQKISFFVKYYPGNNYSAKRKGTLLNALMKKNLSYSFFAS